MNYPKRSQYKYTKKPYRVHNWPEYEAGLQARGDLTLWFSPAAIEAWRARPRGRPGGQLVYSDLAIEAVLTVRMVLSLPLRQAEGFLRSLCMMLELDIPIPDHTTLSRRAKKLGRISLRARTGSRPIHVLVDSTGVRVHVGNSRKPPKSRAWRKLHIAVDATTAEVVAVELTSSSARDSSLVPRLLRRVEQGLVSFKADAAYDTQGVYEAVGDHARDRGRAMPQVLIPPRRRARLTDDPTLAMEQRNRNIRSVEKRGRREWHTASGYSQRSMVENGIYRYKTILGGNMRARSLAGQRLEARLGCRILNTMTQLGMPDSRRVG